MKTKKRISSAIQKKEAIRVKLLLDYYHHSSDFKQTEISDLVNSTKSEVSNCVNTLLKEGYLEISEGRKKCLTTAGFALAEKYHHKYEMFHKIIQPLYPDEETAKVNALALTIVLSDDYINNFKVYSASKLAPLFKDIMDFTSSQFLESAEAGTYPVEFSVMTIPDADSFKQKSPPFAMLTPSREHFDSSEEMKKIPDKAKTGEELLSQNDIWDFEIEHSMADEAFLHPAFIRITDEGACLSLHRVLIRERGKQIRKCKGKPTLLLIGKIMSSFLVSSTRMMWKFHWKLLSSTGSQTVCLLWQS